MKLFRATLVLAILPVCPLVWAQTSPVVTLVANAEGENPTIAPNTWVEIKGSNLAASGVSSPDCAPGYCWQASDFVNNQLPVQLHGVSVTVSGRSAYIYYISPTQLNILTPPNAISGLVQVVVTNNGTISAAFTVQAQALSPSFFVFNGGPYVGATHVGGALIGPPSLYTGLTTPAKPGEIVVLYANGFGQTSLPVVSGSETQSGSLSPLPVITIGGLAATVQFAGLAAPGEFQFNVVVPATTPDGDNALTASYNGSNTQSGVLITVQSNNSGSGSSGVISVDANALGPVINKDAFGINMCVRCDISSPASQSAMLKSVGVNLVRWPGGTYSDQYHWQTNAWSGTSATCGSASPLPSANAFDSMESTLVLPEQLDLIATVNYGTNAQCNGPADANEAAQWVAYAKSKGYGIRYWTVGNEVYGDWEPDLHSPGAHDPNTYANSVSSQFYPLMKAADPSAQVGVVVDAGLPSYAAGWDPIVLSNAQYDFVELHFYPQNPGKENDQTLLTQAPGILDGYLTTVQRELAAANHPNTPIILGEYNSVSSNPGKQSVSIVNALYIGMIQGEILKAGLPVAVLHVGPGEDCSLGGNLSSQIYGWQTFGSYGLFPLVEGLPSCPASANVSTYTVFPIARAHALSSQFGVPGNNMLGVTVPDGLPNVRAYAAQQGQGYALMLFNLDESNATTVTINIANASAQSYWVDMTTYDKQIYDQSASGVWAGPTAVNLGAVSLPVTATLQPWSMNVIRLVPESTSSSGITSVKVTCTSPSVAVYQTDQCVATVQGVSNENGSVNWSATAGSMSTSGIFLAPGTTGQVGITATSTADPSIVGFTTVTVTPPAPTFSHGPNFGTFSIGDVEIPLTATGGNGTYIWSVAAGTLPPGVSLRTDPSVWFPASASAGLIGVATTPGTYTFTLAVTSEGSTAMQSATLQISSLCMQDLYRLPDAFVGVSYSYALSALNQAGAVTWTSTGSLPPGMNVSSAGVLSGTPTAAGTYSINFSLSDGVSTVSRGVSLIVYAISVTTPGILPNATQNARYTATVQAAGGSGSYTFTASGLPSGLAMSPTGVISGTPTNAGQGLLGITVTATDKTGLSYTKRMSLDIVGAPPALPSVAPFYPIGEYFNDCTIGIPCGQQVNAAFGGVAPFTWTATGLPPGMSIHWLGNGPTDDWILPGDAELWGTPTATGVYSVQLTVTDATGATATNTFPLRVSVLETDGNSSLPQGTIGTAYSQTIRILGGSAPYSGQFSGQIAAGLTMGNSSLVVSGTPLESGSNFNALLQFTDSARNTLMITDYFTIDGAGSGAVQFNTGSNLGNVTLGSSYSNQLSACCAAAYTWSLTGGTLPPGIAVSSSGLLSGTLTTQGSYSFFVTVADATNGANYGVRQFTLAVTPISITTGYYLPGGDLSARYDFTLVASGGMGTLTWALPQWSYLPLGLSLAPNGVISGTPTEPGQFTFQVQVTDQVGHADSSDFSISVYPSGH